MVAVLRSRVERLERAERETLPTEGPLLASPAGNGRYEMWGRPWTREEMRALGKRVGSPVLILDLWPGGDGDEPPPAA